MWNISPVLYLLGIKFAWTCDRFRGFSDTSTHVSHCSAVIGTLQVQKSGFASLSSLNAWLCGSVVAQLCPRLKLGLNGSARLPCRVPDRGTFRSKALE
jgi:hypothetical protein